ncbi:MAG: cysteine synthase A [Clostridia bacterium]|nr:cysteine synthase A [Clostridia bacterium]
MKIYENIAQLVGRTPLVRLRKIEKKYGLAARLVAKLESFNPTGSAKDRVAREIIDDAERSGRLTEGSVIIEPTSGNTGIGIAAIAASRGYRAVIVMPSSMSEERRALVRAFGAELVLTDAELGMPGAIAEAERIASETPGAIIAGQFTNPANPAAHRRTTGPEIFCDTEGEVDIFVAGVGTGGTISGVGGFLKEKKPTVKVVAVEPQSSPVLSGGKAGAHGIAGIGAGFVPETLDTGIYDEVIAVETDDAMEWARRLASCEGVLAGISSGAALAAAVEVASREENRGKTVVVLLPDTGERYLSLGIF